MKAIRAIFAGIWDGIKREPLLRLNWFAWLASIETNIGPDQFWRRECSGYCLVIQMCICLVFARRYATGQRRLKELDKDKAYLDGLSSEVMRLFAQMPQEGEAWKAGTYDPSGTLGAMQELIAAIDKHNKAAEKFCLKYRYLG